MKSKKKCRNKKNSFKNQLLKYFGIKGLDIIIILKNGKEIELKKNRLIKGDEILIFEKGAVDKRIPLSQIESVDLYAA